MCGEISCFGSVESDKEGTLSASASDGLCE